MENKKGIWQKVLGFIMIIAGVLMLKKKKEPRVEEEIIDLNQE